jgi:hypothetical protein
LWKLLGLFSAASFAREVRKLCTSFGLWKISGTLSEVDENGIILGYYLEFSGITYRRFGTTYR